MRVGKGRVGRVGSGVGLELVGWSGVGIAVSVAVGVAVARAVGVAEGVALGMDVALAAGCASVAVAGGAGIAVGATSTVLAPQALISNNNAVIGNICRIVSLPWLRFRAARSRIRTLECALPTKSANWLKPWLVLRCFVSS
jgi:hypothetical protein